MPLRGGGFKKVCRLLDIAFDPLAAGKLHGEGKLSIFVATLCPSGIPLRCCCEVFGNPQASRINSAYQRKGLYFPFI